ncbi:MAG: phage tail protein [Aggregatilineales bacterium]
MGTPFLSEIKIVSFNYPPKGWAFCNGQLLPINQNQALFSLLGTTYGGDGRTTFGLPNLQGRVPIHMGQGHTLGEIAGEQSHTLNISEIPQHNHPLTASTAAATTNDPTGSFLATSPSNAYFGRGNPTIATAMTSGNTGGSQAHQNMQPFLTLSFCIALQGIFPTQN